MLKRALITADIHPYLQQQLENSGWQVILNPDITYEELELIIDHFSLLILTTYLRIDKNIIDHALHLKIIGRVGSGMENVDIAYCKEKGISCFNSPEGNANAVGEHALALLLALYNRITVATNELKSGIFNRESNRGEELDGKTVGIIGFGHTGAAFAKKLSGFDVRILAYDPYKELKQTNIEQTALHHLQQEADIISFHVPYSAETHYYCNAAFLQTCIKKPTIINTSRGSVCETPAILTALKQQTINGYCVDVFEDEPLTKNKIHTTGVYEELLAFPNVIATPHIAGWSRQSKLKLVEILWNKIAEHLAG